MPPPPPEPHSRSTRYRRAEVRWHARKNKPQKKHRMGDKITCNGLLYSGQTVNWKGWTEPRLNCGESACPCAPAIVFRYLGPIAVGGAGGTRRHPLQWPWPACAEAPYTTWSLRRNWCADLFVSLIPGRTPVKVMLGFTSCVTYDIGVNVNPALPTCGGAMEKVLFRGSACSSRFRAARWPFSATRVFERRLPSVAANSSFFLCVFLLKEPLGL
mmetsp:Transcript_3189/g.6083  ORF Transcript_3189/g.6083 Transcript_3189/m.6083 type:complete len:214 (+) Transcript_3189:272-913(+)